MEIREILLVQVNNDGSAFVTAIFFLKKEEVIDANRQGFANTILKRKEKR